MAARPNKTDAVTVVMNYAIGYHVIACAPPKVKGFVVVMQITLIYCVV
jgi:hypothetical protein